MPHEFPPKTEDKEAIVDWGAVRARYFNKVDVLINESNLRNDHNRTEKLEKFKEIIHTFTEIFASQKMTSVKKAQETVRYAQTNLEANDTENKEFYDHLWDLLDSRDLKI